MKTLEDQVQKVNLIECSDYQLNLPSKIQPKHRLKKLLHVYSFSNVNFNSALRPSCLCQLRNIRNRVRDIVPRVTVQTRPQPPTQQSVQVQKLGGVRLLIQMMANQSNTS